MVQSPGQVSQLEGLTFAPRLPGACPWKGLLAREGGKAEVRDRSGLSRLLGGSTGRFMGAGEVPSDCLCQA